MNTFFETARFSRTYLGRYWFRFILGIILGVLFGLSNGFFMGSVYLILNRLDDAAHVRLITQRGLEASGGGPKMTWKKKSRRPFR